MSHPVFFNEYGYLTEDSIVNTIPLASTINLLFVKEFTNTLYILVYIEFISIFQYVLPKNVKSIILIHRK